MSFSLPRIILTIGDDGVIAVPVGIPYATPFFTSHDDKLATQGIIEFIDRYPQANITLFVDNLTQDFRIDDLPPLNFIDRKKLIRRRLKQTFPSARLTASLRFRKTPLRVLMIGLHESSPVFAWADRLRTRLPDISLLPVEGARLAFCLMPEAKEGWAMLVGRQKSGGFRQIVTFKKNLVFTRLTPLPPQGFDNEDEIIARDIKASLDYLTRQGLRDPKDLSVLLLAPSGAHDAQAFEGLSLKSIRFLSPAQAARRLALPFAPEDGDVTADILFAAHLISSPRPSLSLMLPETRNVWLTRFVRRWGMRASSVVLIAVIALTLWGTEDFAATLYQTRKEAFRLAKTRHALEREQADAAPLTEPLKRMRQALERRHIYERQAPTPWQGLSELAAGLDRNSKLVKLEWKKEGETAHETFAVTLRMEDDAVSDDRAETVAAFSHVVQNIIRTMPDYSVAGVKPPYPSLPQESVTTAAKMQEEPLGEILLERKSP
jgi:hypothetical protein